MKYSSHSPGSKMMNQIISFQTSSSTIIWTQLRHINFFIGELNHIGDMQIKQKFVNHMINEDNK